MTVATPETLPIEDLPLPCPSCGYDLRGNVGGICPEWEQAPTPVDNVLSDLVGLRQSARR